MSEANKNELQNKNIFIEKRHELSIRHPKSQRTYQIIKNSGKDCFVEVLNESFNKNKVVLNFQQFDESKAKGQRTTSKVKIYMPFSEFRVLANDVLSGRIMKLAEQNKDNPYAKLFESLTGTSAEILEQIKQPRPDGKSESRQFKIIPSNKDMHVRLQAEKGMGEENEKGLIMPRYGTKPEERVTVLISYADLKALVLETIAHMDSYCASQYVLRAMEIEEERRGKNIANQLDTIETLIRQVGRISKNIESNVAPKA